MAHCCQYSGSDVLTENFSLQAVNKKENLNVNLKLRMMLTASVIIEFRVDNRPFKSCFEGHYEGGASCMVLS